MKKNLSLYQGSGKEFVKHDIKHIGSGDNTAYFAHGHHFSESKDVALFYADRTDLTHQGGFIYNVTIDAEILDEDTSFSPAEMESYVNLWYGDEIFDGLVQDIQEKTEYEADETIAIEIATGLLTGNERAISDLLDDVNYGGWEGFKAEHQYKSSDLDTLSVGIDHDQYVDVGRMLYCCALDKFNGVHHQAQQFLLTELNLDGLHYTNFGNGYGSNDEPITNTVIWNDDVINIINIKRTITNDIENDQDEEPIYRRPTRR